MLTAGERRRVLLLAPLMALNGFLQSLSLAALLPFIALILDPAAVEGSGYLATLYRFAGSPGFRTFVVLCSLAVFAAVLVKTVSEVTYTYVPPIFNTFMKNAFGGSGASYPLKETIYVKPRSQAAMLLQSNNTPCSSPTF